MRRYNGFNLIHKGLRLMLYETAKTIQQNDFTNVASTIPLIQQVKMVVDFYDAHAFHENTIVMPAIKSHNPELVEKFEAEHHEDHELGARLLAAVTSWEDAVTAEDQMEAGWNILYIFNDFSAFNIAHMNQEERVLNAELWKHLSDEEIMGFTPRIVQTIEPQKLMVQNEWIFRAISEKEALMMLQGAKKTMPEPVYAGALKLAETSLSPDKWAFVQANLA